MSTALRISLLLAWMVLAWAPDAAARKLFIREIHVAPTCVSVSPEALLAMIAQQVPRDVLARRGLAYEDLPSYLDLASWNADRFNVRQSSNIVRRLHQLDMRYMLWLDLSCLPDGGRARYMLTGRLTDLGAMDRILTCPAAQAGSRAGRRVCNVDGQVYDAVSFTSVELPRFEDFPAAVRELLARLLHVPEVSIGTEARTFDPAQEIDVPFLVRRNDGTEPGYSGSPAPVRGYRMQQDVAQIPSDLYAEVCRAPALRWNQIACRGGFADGRCDAADRIDYDVRTLLHREVPARALARPADDARGGDRITFRAPGHEAFYVLRAEAIADEEGGAVRSNPVYACLHVRARERFVGAEARIGLPFAAVSSGAEFPAASFSTVALGIDAVLHQHLLGSRRWWLPEQVLALSLGLRRVSGAYPPCGQEGHAPCTANEQMAFEHVLRTSTSWSAEVHARLQSALFAVGPCAPLLIAELGVGAEHLSSFVSPFRNDGWGALWTAGVGGGAQCTLGRAGHGATRAWVTAEWQTRARLGARAVPIWVPTDAGARVVFDAPGVPDTYQTLWISVGTSFALGDSDR